MCFQVGNPKLLHGSVVEVAEFLRRPYDCSRTFPGVEDECLIYSTIISENFWDWVARWRRAANVESEEAYLFVDGARFRTG